MPQLLSENVTSFAAGVNDSTAPDEYQPHESARIINFRPALQGNSLKRRGVTWSPSVDSIFGGVNYVPYGSIEFELTSGARQIVALGYVNSVLGFQYSNDQGQTWSQVGSPIINLPASPNERASFATIEAGGINLLIIAVGGVLTYKWDGTTLTALANIPSGVRYVEGFNNRLVAAGHSGTRVVASKVNDPDTWAAPDGWDIDAATSDGDNFITGLFQLGPVMMVFKRESVGYIEGFGFQTLQVQTGARGISRSVGCIASNSIAPLSDYGVMWLSERGFEMYTLSTGFIQLVSRQMQSFVNAIQKFSIVAEGFGTPQAVWVPGKREYWCAVPVGLYSVGTFSGQEVLPNNYVYVYRPGTATEPAAQWAFTWSDDNNNFVNPGSSVEIGDDDSDYPGAMCMNFGDRSGSQMLVGEDGTLRMTEGEEFGIDVTGEGAGRDGAFGFALSSNGSYEAGGSPRRSLLPQVLLTCDHDGQLSQPAFISWDGFFFYADDTETTKSEGNTAEPGFGSDSRDIEGIARLRPMLFGDQFIRKQVHRVRVQSAQDVATPITIQVFGDGEANAAQTVSAPITRRGRPAKTRVRAKGKGYVLDIELESGSPKNDSFEVVAVEVDARYLRETR